MATQQDLQWEETLFGLVPRWKRDPSIAAIETVCRQQLNIPPQDPCTVSFHASGIFNKLYTVQSTGLAPLFLMRVTLPAYPHRKTRCEVTTLRWVRENTSVPVPEVFAFDESSDNEISFEWILIEFVQGVSADKLWPSLSTVQKAAFTEQIAGFVAELSGLGRVKPWFRGIGTLDVLRDSDIKNNGGQPDHADKKSSDSDDPGINQKDVDQNQDAEYKDKTKHEGDIDQIEDRVQRYHIIEKDNNVKNNVQALLIRQTAGDRVAMPARPKSMLTRRTSKKIRTTRTLTRRLKLHVRTDIRTGKRQWLPPVSW